MNEVVFHGAAREVTGSCHILHVNGRTVLLDCGLFQGRRADVHAKNRALPAAAAGIDAIVLSHAHIDHAGRLPFLVHEGYAKTIHATPATIDLSEVMLADAAHIQEQDAEFLSRHHKAHADPLYAMRDAVRTIELMKGARYNEPFEPVPGMKVTFVDAGHILGSASVIVDLTDGATTRRLVFSGDIGRKGLPIIRDPVPPTGAHTVIMESTYGNRDHSSVAGAKDELARVVRETAARGGRVLIPAFAVGRTQEIVLALHELAEAGAIPRIPVYIDSPLATKATAVFDAHRELYDDSEVFVRTHKKSADALFKFPSVQYTQSVEESKALNTMRGPIVIIAASGMAESGRILHHLANGAPDPRNTILVVGFMAEGTLGRKIVEKQPAIRVYGEDVPLRARVEVIDGYSAHADRTELRGWIDAVRAQSPSLGAVCLVHGEPTAQDAFAAALKAGGYRVNCPVPGASATL
ncbi:MAG: MBL fold metallo-hydrolase RNA specificity domain-containing protein [Gemmatimonadaceae bacterium]